MPANTWPWITEVEKEVDGSKYGYNLCGDLKFEVLLIEESSLLSFNRNLSALQKIPTNLVSITPDSMLLFEPTLAHQPGSYKMALVASLLDYAVSDY